MQVILEAQQLSRSYPSGAQLLTVLDQVSFSISRGERVAIVGPSGSGKTTLLGLCAGLDKPTSGSVTIDGQQLNNLNEDQLALLRNAKVGFIFQDFQLIPTLTALENVTIPLELQGKKQVHKAAMELLARVGLGSRTRHYPNQLSGGEQQRVSLARAFINAPALLFADEPTGNLDEETGAQVEALMFDLNRQEGTTLVIVTHDLELAKKTDRIIRLKGGHIISDQPVLSEEKT